MIHKAVQPGVVEKTLPQASPGNNRSTEHAFAPETLAHIRRHLRALPRDIEALPLTEAVYALCAVAEGGVSARQADVAEIALKQAEARLTRHATEGYLHLAVGDGWLLAGDTARARQHLKQLPELERAAFLARVAESEARHGDASAALETVVTGEFLATRQQREAKRSADVFGDEVWISLLGARAVAGDSEGARHLAASLAAPGIRASALLRIASAQEGQGETESITATLNAAQDAVLQAEWNGGPGRNRGVVQAMLVGALARQQAWAKARRMAQEIPGGPFRAEALRGITDAYTRFGQLRDALTTAKDISDPLERGLAIATVAQEMARQGNPDEAKATANLALRNPVTSEWDRVSLNEQVSTVAVLCGEWNVAEAYLHTLATPGDRASYLTLVSRSVAA